MTLDEYRRKRDFDVTPEPLPKSTARQRAHYRFVIQKHAATRLHFDLRLELGGALVSWAVPKGLPLVHAEKRLAVKVEDHPVSYFHFEGVIPKGQYGGGTVQVWDTGSFKPLGKKPLEDLGGGKLHLKLDGQKLSGEWYLVRLREESQWLIIRAGKDHPPISKQIEARSVLTGRTMRQIATAAPPSIAPTPSGPRKRNPLRGSDLNSPKEPPARAPRRQPAALGDEPAGFVKPMMAKLVSVLPNGEWEYEVKFDGFRALACKNGDHVELVSRTKKLMTGQFPEVVRAVQELKAKDAVFDGEIVALDDAGRSSFQLLQSSGVSDDKPSLYYYVFDLLRLNGHGLCGLPLADRKRKLEALVPATDGVIRFSPSLGGDGEALMALARRHGLEGLVGKRAHSLYESGQRSGSWIKMKLTLDQEFVIGGYTAPSGTRRHIGALLVGTYENRRLQYAGKVGTGFSEEVLRSLYDRFDRIAQAECPFVDLPETRRGRFGQGITASVMKNCRWVKPVTVAQIKFSEWTRDGRLRQPVFIGLREDKLPKTVIRETPA